MNGFSQANIEYEHYLSEPPRDYDQEREEKEERENYLAEMSYEESRLFAFEMDMLQAEAYSRGY